MGREELHRMRVDFSVLLKEVFATLERETEDRTVSWGIAVLPVVTGDRAMLKLDRGLEAFAINLAVNGRPAVKKFRQCLGSSIGRAVDS